MTKEIKYGLIGCGRVAGHHARALAKTDNSRVVAVTDLREDRLAQMAETVDVPGYQNYAEMFERHPEIDIACIITPSGMHYEHACDVIERFGKHVVIEKPFVMRPDQGRALIDLAARKQLKLYPVYQNRYNTAVARIKRAVDDGELGELRLCTVRVRWCRPQPYYDRDPWRGTFSHDGGAMTNQGIHYLDLFRYLGGEVKQVQAMLKTLGADVEVEDTAVAMAEFANGAAGLIEITTAARPDDFEASISLLGSKGFALLGGLATNRVVTFTPDPTVTESHSVEIPDAYGYGHEYLFREIERDLAGESAELVTPEDGLRTIELLHALYRSDELGTWVQPGPDGISERLGRSNEEISDLYRR